MNSKDDAGGIVMGIIGILVVLGLVFVWFILPIMQAESESFAPSSPYLDDSAELKTQDSKAQQYVIDEERKQQQKERQDEYEDYLLWLRETGR